MLLYFIFHVRTNICVNMVIVFNPMLSLLILCIITGTSPVVLSGLTEGRHVLRISPLGCSGGSKTLNVQFDT